MPPIMVDLIIAALITMPVTLAGCDKNADALKAEASADTMGNMAMPADAKIGKGTGTVTALDAAAGKITLDHEAIAAVGWPAMKMGSISSWAATARNRSAGHVLLGCEATGWITA